MKAAGQSAGDLNHAKTFLPAASQLVRLVGLTPFWMPPGAGAFMATIEVQCHDGDYTPLHLIAPRRSHYLHKLLK